MIRLLRYVSLRHLTQTPLRTLLTVIGIAVGVAVTVAISAVNRSVLDAFQSTVDTVSGRADLTVSAGSQGFPEETLEQVKAVEGVAKAAGSVSLVARTPGHGADCLYVLGVDMTDDGYFREYKSAGKGPDIGDPLAFLNSPDAMLVGERYAASQHLKVGDKLQLQTANGVMDFTVRGLLAEDGPVKAFGGAFGVMDLFAAQAAFGKDRKFDRIDVAVTTGVDIEAVKQRLAQALGDRYDVERPDRRGGSVQNMLRSFQMALNLGSVVAMLVGIFLVYNTVSISVVQRRREIGTLRALGTSGAAIRVLFALEASVFGLAGTALGIPLGWLVAQQAMRVSADSISSLYVQVRAQGVGLTPLDVAVGATLGMLGSVFAAFRPASHAASVQPVEALRRDVAAGAGPQAVRRDANVAALLMLALAVPVSYLPAPWPGISLGGHLALLCILGAATLASPLLLRLSHRLFVVPAQALAGIAGRLAADNFSRAPGRSAVPVAALAIGVAMTVCIGGYVEAFKNAADRWIDQSIPADVFLTASYKFAGVRNTPLGPQLGEELEKLEGVAHVDRIRMVHVDYQGLYVFVLSLQPDVYFLRGKPRFLSGEPDEAIRVFKSGGVLVSENLSRRRHFKAGDTLELKTPTGTHRYPVAGVIVDYTSDQGVIGMPRDVYVRDFQDELVDTYELYLKPGVSFEETRRTVLDRWGKQYDLFALSNAELRAESRKLLDEVFQVTYAMEFVAVMLALLGVINTLIAAVIDRTRELGLLRAVGATRGQIMAAITTEAALIGIAGGAIGVAAGSLMAYVITVNVGAEATGWNIPFAVPWKIATQITLGATAAAMVAGLYPAWRASKLDVVEALAYE